MDSQYLLLYIYAGTVGIAFAWACILGPNNVMSDLSRALRGMLVRMGRDAARIYRAVRK